MHEDSLMKFEVLKTYLQPEVLVKWILSAYENSTSGETDDKFGSLVV